MALEVVPPAHSGGAGHEHRHPRLDLGASRSAPDLESRHVWMAAIPREELEGDGSKSVPGRDTHKAKSRERVNTVKQCIRNTNQFGSTHIGWNRLLETCNEVHMTYMKCTRLTCRPKERLGSWGSRGAQGPCTRGYLPLKSPRGTLLDGLAWTSQSPRW